MTYNDKGEEEFFSILEDAHKSLNEIKPICEEFCDFSGFKFDNAALGRYPRIRLRKTLGSIEYFYDLWVEFPIKIDEYKGKIDAIPYGLGAGAWIDVGKLRYGKILNLFDNKTIFQLSGCLRNSLLEGYKEMSLWTLEFIMATGDLTKIGDRPEILRP